jgi:dihydroorotate dehydrogenase
LTNTLGGTFSTKGVSLEGGWSGKPLQEASRNVLQRVRSYSQKPIISVGGIMSTQEGFIRRELGADLLQIYSGWIFEGPGFPRRLSQAIS